MARILTEEQKQRARDRAREWHWANRDKAIETSRRLAADNREDARERTKLWRAANPEKARANDAKKRANRAPEYLEKRRIDEQNRRARKKASGGRLSKGLATRLYSEQDGKCVYCKGALQVFHMDHILALAAGGLHTDSNIQLLCPDCNRRKHVKTHEEFTRQVGV